MGLIKSIKSFRWGYLLIACLLSLAGLCVIAYPTESFKTVSYIIAVGTILAGIILVVKTLSERKRGVRFATYIIFACLVLICGLVSFIIPEKIAELYPMFFGLLIIIDGSFKLQTVIHAKRYKLKMWWFLLFLSCLTILGGFLTVRLRVAETEIGLFSFILGAGLLLCGIQNFFSLFYLGKIVKMAKIEYDSYATEITDDGVIADSYLEDGDKKHKAVILPKVKKIKKEELPIGDDTEFIKITKSDFVSVTTDSEE